MKLVHAVWEPAGNGPFPAILAMHGWGSNALDLLGLAPYVANGRFLVVCPQGPEPVEFGAVNGFGWYPRTPGATPEQSKVDAAAEGLHDFIGMACERYPIDRSKLVVLGFSQGGGMAFNLGLRWPEEFAALVGIATAFPSALAERVTNPGAIEKLPTLVQHGRVDETIEIARARQGVEALRKLKLPVVYHEYNCGHELTAEGIRDLSAFLTERVLEPSASA